MLKMHAAVWHYAYLSFCTL